MKKEAEEQAIYPEWLFTEDQIKKGGFVVYGLFIFYMFQGISLAT